MKVYSIQTVETIWVATKLSMHTKPTQEAQSVLRHLAHCATAAVRAFLQLVSSKQVWEGQPVLQSLLVVVSRAVVPSELAEVSPSCSHRSS